MAVNYFTDILSSFGVLQNGAIQGFSSGNAAEAKENLEATLPQCGYARSIEIAKLRLCPVCISDWFITRTVQVIDAGVRIY